MDIFGCVLCFYVECMFFLIWLEFSGIFVVFWRGRYWVVFVGVEVNVVGYGWLVCGGCG